MCNGRIFKMFDNSSKHSPCSDETGTATERRGGASQTLFHPTDAVVVLPSLVRLSTFVRRASNSLCLRHTSRLTSVNSLSITLQISVTAVFVKAAITDATCSLSSWVNILKPSIGRFLGEKIRKNISGVVTRWSTQIKHTTN